jgi:DMSO/TMAO reductase YedYZ molybdopterin-dependent catalytic subunit
MPLLPRATNREFHILAQHAGAGRATHAMPSPHPPQPPGPQLVATHKWPTVGERQPRRDDSPWTVRAGGLVQRPCTFAPHDLASLTQVERLVDIHCVTRWSKPQVRFRGVPLAALLERVAPLPEARYLSFTARSDRRHSTSLVLAEALALDVLVALEVEGAPLAAERGGPVRVVVPGRYFYKSLKWLESIELLAADRLGFWESTAGYHNHADPWHEERYPAPGLTKAQARELLAGRNICGRDLRSLRAAGLELSGLAAENALLRDADFRDCDLRNARFDGANLSNAHFDRATLAGASFRGADLEGADFAGADLRGACFAAASLLGASFCQASDGNIAAPAQLDRVTCFDPASLADLAPQQQAFLHTFLTQTGEPPGDDA